MGKKVGILGSTGSIGTQTLAVIRELNARPESEANPHCTVSALAAGRNVRLLAEQAREFGVRLLCVERREDEQTLRDALGAEFLQAMQPAICSGPEGLRQVAEAPQDLFVTAIVGMRGLEPTLAAIDCGTDIALANKETLVAAGDLVMRRARERGVSVLPVDSEHAAILQCLCAAGRGGAEAVDTLILTASGGPFLGYTAAQLQAVTLEDALRHPTWKMGGKITVDCATLMNKGLEVIEAMHLFSMPVSRIEVVVHPQSIIHSMVRFVDGSVLAQLGNPDMKVPIQLALTYPYRARSQTKRLDLTEIATLTFLRPDADAFPCLSLAYGAAGRGGTMPCAMNGANEQATEYFLKKQMNFTDIPYIIERVMDLHEQGREESFAAEPTLADILRVDAWAKQAVRRLVCR